MEGDALVFSIVGTLNPGGPEYAPEEIERFPKDERAQPKEDVHRIFRESDPPMVVRDGNAVHTSSPACPVEARQRSGQDATQARHLPRDTNTPIKGFKPTACNGGRLRYTVSDLASRARVPEEPGAVIPQAGIRWGRRVKPAFKLNANMKKDTRQLFRSKSIIYL